MTPAIVFIIGLILGSFLSVVFSRLEIDDNLVQPKKGRSRRGKGAKRVQTASLTRPSRGKGRGENDTAGASLRAILFGRSRCDHCQVQIHWYDNVPLLSYLVLRARCRHCAKPISHFHPVLELCAALSLLAAYFQFGLTPLFGVVGTFSLVMLLIFSYDLKHSLIPNAFVVPALAAALVLLAVQYILFSGSSSSVVTLWSPDPVRHVLGGLVGGGFFLALSILSRGTWVGGGDVKLGALIGVLLGWPYVIAALILAYVIGTVYSLLLLLSRQATLKTLVPFGPMLVTGFFVMAYYGDWVIEWYEGWFL